MIEDDQTDDLIASAPEATVRAGHPETAPQLNEGSSGVDASPCDLPSAPRAVVGWRVKDLLAHETDPSQLYLWRCDCGQYQWRKRPYTFRRKAEALRECRSRRSRVPGNNHITDIRLMKVVRRG